MNLVIVESPVKSKTISRYLGPKYKVLSSYGHVRDLPKSKLGVDIENNFQPKYIIPTKSRKTINLLKKESEKAENVILACDQDREGEAIAWHLAQALGLNKKQTSKEKKDSNSKKKAKKYERIVFHEITKEAIEKALKNPRKININLVNAQQARRVLDRIVGYKLSPFLWKKVARGLSAGRVQSVAVRLVAEREKEIESFVPQEYWTIEAKLQPQENNDKNDFLAKLIKKDGEKIPKLGIKTKKETDEIIKNLKKAEYKVLNIEKKEVKRNPLPPFTTSTLQQTAWQKFKWPAKQTMRIGQQLYEKGFITYHRTDSLNISNLALNTAKKFIEKNYGQNYYQFRKYKTKSKSAQEAHEAIRPSYPKKTPDGLKIDNRQKKLYDLIWRRFIACQMSQARFDSTTIDIEAEKNIFRATGQVLKFDGFLKIYPLLYKEAELPLLKEGQILKLLKLIPSQHFTQPPPRYNEASLIKVLEENGIGRPSTYAPILSTIQERNYIQKDEKKRLQLTEIGGVVNNILVNHFPKVVDIGFTAKMEEELDKVADGKKEWTLIIKKFYMPFEENLKEKEKEISKKSLIEKTNKICPRCGSPIIIRLGKFGKFYACSGFPKCKYTEPLKKETLGIKCPQCEKGEIVEKRTRKGKIFYGCNKWPECDFALWDKPTGEKCPKCNSLLIATKKDQIKCSSKDCAYKKKKGS